MSLRLPEFFSSTARSVAFFCRAFFSLRSFCLRSAFHAALRASAMYLSPSSSDDDLAARLATATAVIVSWLEGFFFVLPMFFFTSSQVFWFFF